MGVLPVLTDQMEISMSLNLMVSFWKRMDTNDTVFDSLRMIICRKLDSYYKAKRHFRMLNSQIFDPFD